MAARAILTRDVGTVTMTMANTETIDVNALGGADTITVNDLSKTDVRHVAIDLSATPGSGVGDGQADTVVINATNGNDVINIVDNNGVVTVTGLAADVTITGFEAPTIASSSTVSVAMTSSPRPGLRPASRSPPMAATATMS